MTARSTPSNDCDTIVIGAGPYGLAVATHLKARGVTTHVFGEPMSFWRHHMPKGMWLRSPWGATNISDPTKALTLDAYLAGAGAVRVQPLPLETFVGYGTWFQARAVPDVDRRMVERVEVAPSGFRVVPTVGEDVHARRVVVATGLANQEFRPAAFAFVPRALASHSSDHADFAGLRGKRVAVIGRGQSATESAVLLHEAGAEVHLICRGPIHWLSDRKTSATWRATLKARVADLLAAPSGVGPFPLNWAAELPHFTHRLPADARAAFNAACLRAGAAGWLRPRFGGVRVTEGVNITGAIETGGRVEIKFDHRSEVFDHVVLATGYRTDIARLRLFRADLLGAIACEGGAPVLSGSFESSVPGLHFVGASAVTSLGPLLRFIAGTTCAARAVAGAAAPGRRPIKALEPGAVENDLAA
jgi:pyridine nucleotide-disulfide oxidoreductase